MPKYRFEEIAFNSTEKKKPVDSDKFTYIGLEHLDSGNLQVTRFGADTAPSGDKLVMKKGDVLFGKRRAYQKKVAIAPFDGIFSAHGMVLRPKAVADPRFFPFFIASDYFLDAAIKISVGSLSPTINWRDLAQLEFELPDLMTQAKLADIMEALTRTKHAYEQLIAASDELVKSQFVEMFGDTRTNPKQWRTASLESIASVGSSKRVFVEELQEQGIPFFRGTEVGALATGEKVVPELYITEEHYQVLKEATGVPVIGDLLMPSICPDGRIWIVDTDKPFYFKDGRVLWVHPTDEAIDSCYLLYALKNTIMTDYGSIASGTTFAELKIFALKALSVMLPPMELQKQFSIFIAQTDKSKYVAQKATTNIKTYGIL